MDSKELLQLAKKEDKRELKSLIRGFSYKGFNPTVIQNNRGSLYIEAIFQYQKKIFKVYVGKNIENFKIKINEKIKKCKELELLVLEKQKNKRI